MTVIDDYNSDFTSISDDIIFDENRGYEPGAGGGSGSTFWSLKQPSSLKIYFTTPGPWTKNEDHGWWTWREVAAFDGLVGVGELPNGLRTFPVRDQVAYVDGDGNQRRRDIRPDEAGFDHLLSLVVPSKNRYSGRVEINVKDAVGVSVVEVSSEGTLYPKVLKMSANRYRKLFSTIQGYRAMNPGFTLMGFPWILSITGDTTTNEVISLLPQPDGGPIDLPDPIDIPEQLRMIKQQVMEIVQSHTGVDTTSYAAAEAAQPAPGAVQGLVIPPGADGSAPVVPVTPAAEPDLVPPAPAPEPAPEMTKAELYENMTDPRLKTLLTKKGIEVPPKTPRAKLLELANTHQV